ncbi:MAG: aldo/keto reductase [Anaerovibrio sp.]|uniref:aldo/keto reductase n=1 Tax=Anaerovibrio sp. TaxID=1872532 RepID=UPI0025DDC9C8|nr:aldo/keto reductase [Anaerovibrio sp.]MCR5176675.1 aldo/keto reductase [Anaerovibrio sp.]
MKKNIRLKNGTNIPPLGLGTWCIGDRPEKAQQEITALLTGIDQGMTLIDTAEMYGEGLSEKLVGKVISKYLQKGNREDLYIVSKVLPWNAGRNKIHQACESSMKRLEIDYLDLYLYHWIGDIPLAEVVEGLNQLQEQGLIRGWGVSNFDTADIKQLLQIPGGENCLVNQNLYHPASRGIEYDLLELMYQHDIIHMSYCPLAQGGRIAKGLQENATIRDIAEAHNVTPSQVLLAWNIRNGKTVAIPKSASANHIMENAAACDITLTPKELEAIDTAYPPPTCKLPLDTE